MKPVAVVSLRLLRAVPLAIPGCIVLAVLVWWQWPEHVRESLIPGGGRIERQWWPDGTVTTTIRHTNAIFIDHIGWDPVGGVHGKGHNP